MAEVKVRVQADSAYYYPDVAVTSDPADLGSESPKDYPEAPKLVLEVLSDCSEPVDRREKWMCYRRLPSLMEYVLIDRNRAWVEVFRRSAAGWTQDIYQAGETVRLDSVALDVSMAALYADTGVLAESCQARAGGETLG